MIITEIKEVKKILYEYPHKLLTLELIQERIKAIEEAKRDPTIELIPPKKNTFFTGDSIVEREVMKVMTREDNLSLLNDWLSEERSKLFVVNLNVQQLKIVLKSLTKDEYTLVDLKYFERMSWNDIEANFNKNGGDIFVTIRTLRRMNDNLLSKLVKLLSS